MMKREEQLAIEFIRLEYSDKNIKITEHDDGSKDSMFDLEVIIDDNHKIAIEVTTLTNEKQEEFLKKILVEENFPVIEINSIKHSYRVYVSRNFGFFREKTKEKSKEALIKYIQLLEKCKHELLQYKTNTFLRQLLGDIIELDDLRWLENCKDLTSFEISEDLSVMLSELGNHPIGVERILVSTSQEKDNKKIKIVPYAPVVGGENEIVYIKELANLIYNLIFKHDNKKKLENAKADEKHIFLWLSLSSYILQSLAIEENLALIASLLEKLIEQNSNFYPDRIWVVMNSYSITTNNYYFLFDIKSKTNGIEIEFQKKLIHIDKLKEIYGTT